MKFFLIEFSNIFLLTMFTDSSVSCSHTPHTHTFSWTYTHRGRVTQCSGAAGTVTRFLKSPLSQTVHFICPYSSGLPRLTSVMSFHTHTDWEEEEEEEKLLTWTLVPWIWFQWRECADAADCLRKKSQQRSEIKCQQLLLLCLDLQPGFNISYLLNILHIFLLMSHITRNRVFFFFLKSAGASM